MKIFIVLFFMAVFLQFASFLLWYVQMRAYLRENGLSTLRGINYGATILNDVQQIMEVSKEKGGWPNFLTIFFVLEGASIILFALAFILGIK